MDKTRELECYLNKGTLNDLIIAHLCNIGVIRYNEEVTDLFILPSIQEGMFKLTVRFEPDIQVIWKTIMNEIIEVNPELVGVQPLPEAGEGEATPQEPKKQEDSDSHPLAA